MRQQISFQALGSECLITLVATKSMKSNFERLYDVVDGFEKRFSRFIETSEVSKVNLNVGKKQRVSAEFLSILSVCRDFNAITEGLFNPLILPALQEAGYVGSFVNKKLNPNLDFSSRQTAELKQVEVGDTWVKLPENAALDFGGIGKGYLLDILARDASMYVDQGYWISLGGDIIAGGLDEGGQPFEIKVANSIESSLPTKSIDVPGGEKLAVATSGVTKRKGITPKGSWHHLIDPRTGLPTSNGILSVTVTSEKAVNADVLAKSILIGGEEEAVRYQEKGLIREYIIQSVDMESA